MSIRSRLQGKETQFHIELLYGLLFIGGFAYLVFRVDPRVAAFEGGLVVGYLLRIWEKMSIYERILEEVVSREAEMQVAAEVEEQVEDEVATEVEEQVEEEVQAEVEDQVGQEMESEISEQVEEEVQAEIQEQVEEVQSEVEQEMEDQVADEVERQVEEKTD
ncbi:MAG: hypothetical protein ABEI52_02775 [Halobacteriaceae archaeon]